MPFIKMELNVNKHLSKLLNAYFMHLVPFKISKVEKGKTYVCISPEYGELGILECISVHTSHLCEVSETVSLMANGNKMFQQDAEKIGIKKLDMIQCCIFKFNKRNNAAFVKLIEREASKMNLQLIKQATIF